MDTRIPTQDEIEAMSETEYKVLENRLRRAADRQGLRIVKSRRRDPRAIDYGSYWLLDVETSGIVEGDRNVGMTLADVADFLWCKDGAWWRNPVAHEGPTGN
jgi:hypothetical protein